MEKLLEYPLPEVKKSKYIVKESPDVYKMKLKPRGPCLIINNINFSHLTKRLGSEHDARRLESVFKALHFEVTVKQDLKSQEILDALRDMADEVTANCDAAVVVIMTHGHKDLICGIDYTAKDERRRKISYEDIVEPLNNVNCFNLRHKPKMFFIQACMGSKTPVGVEDCINLFPVRTTRRLPQTSDVIVSFASQEGFSATRNEILGSPFATNLAYALAEHAYNKDLIDILSIVERNVQQTLSILKSTFEEMCLSTSVKLLGWSKKVFFNPTDSDAVETYLPDPFEKLDGGTIEWQYSDAYSEKQEIHDPVSSESQLWVIGGSGDPEVLQGTNRSWIMKFGTGLHGFYTPIAGSSGNVVYVHLEDEIFSWNVKKGKVSLLIKTMLLGSSLAYHDDKIFVMGGDILGSTTFTFDTTTGKWTDTIDGKSLTGSQNSFGKPALVFKDKIYLFQGGPDEVSGTLNILDTKQLSWSSSKSAMKIARRGQVLAACSRYIWVFGGDDGSRCFSEVERYCPDSDTWESKKSMLTPRTKFSVAFFQGKFYASGGQTDKHRKVDVVEIYDPKDDQWSKGSSLQMVRAGHGSIVN